MSADDTPPSAAGLVVPLLTATGTAVGLVAGVSVGAPGWGVIIGWTVGLVAGVTGAVKFNNEQQEK